MIPRFLIIAALIFSGTLVAGSAAAQGADGKPGHQYRYVSGKSKGLSLFHILLIERIPEDTVSATQPVRQPESVSDEVISSPAPF